MSMTLKLPHDYSMQEQDNQYQRRMEQDKKLLDLKHWFKKNYPQIVLEGIPYFKLVKMFQFIQENGGVFAKQKTPNVRETVIQENGKCCRINSFNREYPKLEKMRKSGIHLNNQQMAKVITMKHFFYPQWGKTLETKLQETVNIEHAKKLGYNSF